MNFAVVAFPKEDDYLGVIPTNWINSTGKSCLYPNVATDFAKNKMIYIQEEPKSDWREVQIRILKKYEKYDTAKAHLSDFENRSNIDSEGDTTPTRKRRRKERIIVLPGELLSSEDERTHIKYKKNNDTAAHLSDLEITSNMNYECDATPARKRPRKERIVVLPGESSSSEDEGNQRKKPMTRPSPHFPPPHCSSYTQSHTTQTHFTSQTSTPSTAQTILTPHLENQPLTTQNQQILEFKEEPLSPDHPSISCQTSLPPLPLPVDLESRTIFDKLPPLLSSSSSGSSIDSIVSDIATLRQNQEIMWKALGEFSSKLDQILGSLSRIEARSASTEDGVHVHKVKAKAYAICKLPEEGDDIIVVCSNWLLEDENMTMYPPRSQSSSLKKLLMNKVDASSSWKKYPVSVMGYYETYEKAQEKLRKATETSSLESSDDEVSKKSRNQRKKKSLPEEFRFLDNCSTDEGDSSSKVICQAEKPFPRGPPQLTSFIQPIESQQKNKAPCPSSFAASNNLTVDSTNSQSCSVPSPPHLLLHFADETHTPHSSQHSGPSSPLPSSYTVGDGTIPSQLQISMAEISNQQKRILEELQQLKSEQRFADIEKPEPCLSDAFPTLPLTTEAGFQELQDQLDDKMAKQFVRLLTSLRGKDLQQSIHHMLRRVMVDQLATVYTFSGKPVGRVSKPAFRKTKICKFILVAVQKIFGAEEATEAKFASIVSKWLQQAKTRIERRTVCARMPSSPTKAKTFEGRMDRPKEMTSRAGFYLIKISSHSSL